MGPRTVRPRRVKASQSGAQTWKKWGPEGLEPRRVGGLKVGGGQNFELFFPLPPQFSFFLSVGPEMCTFGVLGLSCETPAVSRTFLGASLQKHHQNSTKRHRERHKKERNGVGRGEKRSEILGDPTERGPAEGAGFRVSGNRKNTMKDKMKTRRPISIGQFAGRSRIGQSRIGTHVALD